MRYGCRDALTQKSQTVVVGMGPLQNGSYLSDLKTGPGVDATFIIIAITILLTLL